MVDCGDICLQDLLALEELVFSTTLIYEETLPSFVGATDDAELQEIMERKMLEMRSGDMKMETHRGSITLSDADFQKVVGSSTPTIVDFWAEWCGPCRVMHPIFEKLAGKYAEKMTFARMNVDENPKAPSGLGIFSIPTFVVFRNGKVVDSVVGAIGETGLEKAIQKHVS